MGRLPLLLELEIARGLGGADAVQPADKSRELLAMNFSPFDINRRASLGRASISSLSRGSRHPAPSAPR